MVASAPVERTGGKIGVAVLGMHRSGTSAVAGFLARAGFYAGEEDELLAPAEDNPKGFFERTDVNELNDSLLAKLGGSWDRPPRRELVAQKGPRWTDEVQKVLGQLSKDAGGRPLLVKDPRISLLLPAWLPALEDNYAIVLVDRSPMDIAQSIRRRDGRPLYVALALWQLYFSELFEALAGRRALVVRYENFVERPSQQGSALFGNLQDVLQPGAAAADPSKAEGFVSMDMRHHRTALKSSTNLEVLTGTQLSLARWLAELPEGWVELQPPAKLRAQSDAALVVASEYYDAVADRHGMETAYDLERHKALHFEQATELKDRHIENLEAAVGGLQRRDEENAARIAGLEAEVARLLSENQTLSSQLRALREDSRAAATNLIAVARRAFSGH